MNRFVAAGVTAAAVFALPAAAEAQPSHRDIAYGRAYSHVVHVYGKRAAGCKLIGPGSTCHVKHPSDRQIRRSTDVLRRMVAPPPAPAAVASVVASAVIRHSVVSSIAPAVVHTPPAVTAPGGAGAVPTCAAESGTNYSTGPANTNPSSGATGRWQITPSTAANYGCSLATPAGQDACAAVIYQHQGASAWVGCGG